jgi:hypothetical protein
VAPLPEGLTLERNRDLAKTPELVARWAFFTLLGLIFALALVGVFGQSPDHSRAVAPAAELEVSAPTKVRGGLFFQGRFTIRARQDIDHATLVLERGWLESMHINTIVPAPLNESSREGRLALDFGHVSAGAEVVVYLQFQVNPTNLARRAQDVSLYDGTRLLASAQRTVTIYP